DDLPAALDLLAAMMRSPAFDPERLETARLEAIERVRRQNDEPHKIASRILMHAIYGDHPLGRTPTVASLNAVSRDDLLAFARRYLHPNNLWLAISGDFDTPRLRKQLGRAFSGWASQQFAPQPLPPVASAASPLVLVVSKALPQTTIFLGELGIDKSSPDLYALRVMNYILGGGGFNSHLMREIRSNRGLAYSVYSQFEIGRRLPGPFVAVCETKSGSTLQVVRLMRQAEERMRQTPVAAQELKLAKESLVNSFVFAFAESRMVTNLAMRLDFYGYPSDYLQRYRDRIEAVTAADVQRVARSYLHPDRQTFVLVGDPEKFDANPATLGLPVKTLDVKGP
ncbi:MAG TPA: pitrilysin family protein, partial [Desulfuromonadales bacterium]|nr:pitrilysin family protein [Desulfuromonadales bacterium]